MISLESRPLNFHVFKHGCSLRPQKYFRSSPNTRTKSIQKQVKSIDVDKVASKKHLASKSVSFRVELIASSFLDLLFKQARRNAAVSGFLFNIGPNNTKLENFPYLNVVGLVLVTCCLSHNTRPHTQPPRFEIRQYWTFTVMTTDWSPCNYEEVNFSGANLYRLFSPKR